jgi:hypothetical protein
MPPTPDTRLGSLASCRSLTGSAPPEHSLLNAAHHAIGEVPHKPKPKPPAASIHNRAKNHEPAYPRECGENHLLSIRRWHSSTIRRIRAADDAYD